MASAVVSRARLAALVGLSLVVLLVVGSFAVGSARPLAVGPAGRGAIEGRGTVGEGPERAGSSDAPARRPSSRGPVGPLALALDPQPAQQGGQVEVSGRGFAAGESVAISASRAEPGSEMLPLSRAAASPSGTVDAVRLTLPDDVQSGPHAIEALGETSGRQSTGTLWVHAPEPWTVLSGHDVQQYEDFGLVAGGFEPGEDVQVSIEPRVEHAAPVDGARAPSQPSGPVSLVSLSTDQAGNSAWTQVKLPAVRVGLYTLVLRGRTGGQELRRDMQVKSLTPTVELSPWAGPPGIPVELNARGFAPNERVRVALGTGTGEPGEVRADQYGNLWGAGPVRIPQTAPAGGLAVNLVGEESGAHASPEFKVLEPKPWLELTSWWGPPGSPVGFSGGGWIAGERISFHLGRAENPAQAFGVADDHGWLRYGGPMYVPADADQDVTLVAVGEVSHTAAAATFKLVFPFGLRPQPDRSAPAKPSP